MIPADWAEHRREDGERVGWIRPSGDDWQAVDVLGREVGAPTDWLAAEAALEAHGLAWLAERWWLGPMQVRIAEVSPDGIAVLTDDYGAASVVDGHAKRIALPWPAPPALRRTPPTSPDASPLARWYANGRLLGYPNRPEVRNAVLAMVATDAIRPDERLSEKAFTWRLALMTPDSVRLRRELVDRGLVERTTDGAEYWLGSGRPLPEG